MIYNQIELKKIIDSYIKYRYIIEQKLNEFKKNWQTFTNEDILYELIFCLLTPQSKAILCWKAVLKLRADNALHNIDNTKKLLKYLKNIRFYNKKAQYIFEATHKILTINDLKKFIKNFSYERSCREWFVKNIKGLGYKEASHFLRNIGYSQNLAILDRHILKNLFQLNVINNYHINLTKKNYYEIENKFLELSNFLSIPLNALDLTLWAKETGFVFK